MFRTLAYIILGYALWLTAQDVYSYTQAQQEIKTPSKSTIATNYHPDTSVKLVAVNSKIKSFPLKQQEVKQQESINHFSYDSLDSYAQYSAE